MPHRPTKEWARHIDSGEKSTRDQIQGGAQVPAGSSDKMTVNIVHDSHHDPQSSLGSIRFDQPEPPIAPARSQISLRPERD